MQQDFDNINILYPKTFSLDDIKSKRAMQPFNEKAVEFLNALSKEINKDSRTRLFPDVATFAFFCRKANILNIEKRYSFSGDGIRLGRGIVFHIAPSNVPVNFAYSLLCGILAGNINIVRVSSKEFEQVTIIKNAILRIKETGNYDEIADRIVLVQYDRQNVATSIFSSVCDVRVIWGGDETISHIRNSPIPARAFDVTFADRYSLCVIKAENYLEENNPKAVAQGFYNDTYLFDQNACTAPHLVVWLGKKENIEKAKTIFWNNLYSLVKEKYEKIQAVIAVDKLTTLYQQAIALSNINKEESPDNLLWRVRLNQLSPTIDEFRCTNGYFSEYDASSLDEIAGIINNKYQTLSYYGFSEEELKNFFLKNAPSGIDRIVPIGHTMDFSLIWDGYNLIKTLSRSCEIM